MFEDSLLILKCDYLHKRKQVLLTLLQKEFQLQGHRRLLFSPEHAAEFYQERADEKCFMLQVILLSKGNSEAFIVTKENCVEELMNNMVCYFGTSIEMERNVHVSSNVDNARREITFIFPNYIHEPIPSFLKPKFCQNPLLKDLINEVYALLSDANRDNWKVKLAEWLMLSNKSLPRITNQCSHKPLISRDDKSTMAQMHKKGPCPATHEPGETPTGTCSMSSAGSSMVMTTSSCITCSCFDGEETCLKSPKQQDSFERLVKKKVAPLSGSTSSTEPIEWQEVLEEIEEEMGEEEQTKIQSAQGSAAAIIDETVEAPVEEVVPEKVVEKVEAPPPVVVAPPPPPPKVEPPPPPKVEPPPPPPTVVEPPPPPPPEEIVPPPPAEAPAEVAAPEETVAEAPAEPAEEPPAE